MAHGLAFGCCSIPQRVQFLLDQQPSLLTAVPVEGAVTGFHLAAIKGHADVVQVYLKQVGLDCALSDPYLTPCCAVRGQM